MRFELDNLSEQFEKMHTNSEQLEGFGVVKTSAWCETNNAS